MNMMNMTVISTSKIHDFWCVLIIIVFGFCFGFDFLVSLAQKKGNSVDLHSNAIR